MVNLSAVPLKCRDSKRIAQGSSHIEYQIPIATASVPGQADEHVHGDGVAGTSGVPTWD